MIHIPKNGPPTHPGEMLLEEFLKPLNMKQSELAEKLGVSYPRVNELIHGERGITPDTALRLEKLFGMDAQFWLNLQLAWDLYHATRSSTAKEIKKIKRLPALAHDAECEVARMWKPDWCSGLDGKESGG
ncbi:MAG: HigA family addiction module antitoxin [Pseudomonadota bacterium]